MAITSKSVAKTESTVKYEWKTLAIPDSKLVVVYTDNKTGRTSMGFEIAESNPAPIVFYASAKNVKRNADRTGYLVNMPEKETNLTQRGEDNSKATFKASSLQDLGYPFVTR